MYMVGHHVEAQNVDRKDPGQLLQPILDSVFAVIITLSTDGIFAEEPRTSDTSIDAVVDADFTIDHNLFTRVRRHADLRVLWAAFRLVRSQFAEVFGVDQ